MTAQYHRHYLCIIKYQTLNIGYILTTIDSLLIHIYSNILHRSIAYDNNCKIKPYKVYERDLFVVK